MNPTRRTLLQVAALICYVPAMTRLRPFGLQANAEEHSWRHGFSLFGELRYPPQFAHFDYVNPQAPKAGTVRRTAFGTYDNFNSVIAGLKGNLAIGIAAENRILKARSKGRLKLSDADRATLGDERSRAARAMPRATGWALALLPSRGSVSIGGAWR